MSPNRVVQIFSLREVLMREQRWQNREQKAEDRDRDLLRYEVAVNRLPFVPQGKPGYLTVRVSWMGCSWSGCPVEELAVREIVMVEVPEGVTIGGGGAVMDAAPPPQPVSAKVIQKTAAWSIPQSARRLVRLAGWGVRRFLVRSANRKKSRVSKVGRSRRTCEIGWMRSVMGGGN